MRFPAAVLLLSIPLFGQTPPPEVEQALRARVTEFFNYHVDGNFMKAFGLVAEDTREYYFAAQKNRFISYVIGEITWSDNFNNAVVNVLGKRKFRASPHFPETVIDQPMITDWRIEKGQWVWYVRKTFDCPTPMSCGPDGKPRAKPPEATSDNNSKMPDLSPKMLDQRAQEILKQSTVDKPIIAMASTSATSERVVFHNGQPGYVRVTLDPGAEVEGFTAAIEKNDVGPNEDVAITLHYTPGKTPPPLALTIKLGVEPFHQTLAITVKFAK
jgi:hypothetical protein